MKLLKILLLILLCPSIFISCGGNKNGNSEVASNNIAVEPAETAAEIIDPDLPDMDFGGAVYRVLGRTDPVYPDQFANFEIYAESVTGDLINDAVYERNSRLEEKYSCFIEQDLFENPENVLIKSITAGDDIYSLAFMRMREVGTLAQRGNFYDLNSLKYLDFSKPWWSQDVNKALSIEGKLYYTTGDFNMIDKDRTYILLYNKDLAEAYELGIFYDFVYDNTWNVEKMIGLCTAVSGDLDGDGVMTDADRWGLGMDSRNAFYAFINAMDNFIVTKDNNDKPVITVNNDRTIASIDKALRLTNDKNISLYCELFEGKLSYDYWYAAERSFFAQNSLFFADFTQMLKKTSTNVEFNYGVMPYPKFDEKQENYYATPDPVAVSMIVIPSSVQNTDFSSFILEAVCAASKYEVLPKYYEVSAKTKYTYDEESPKMLDLIFSGLRYDLGVIYDWGGLRQLFTGAIPTDGRNTFASKYAALEEKALTQMEKTLEAFRELP